MFDLGLQCEQAFDYTIEQAFAQRVPEICHRASIASFQARERSSRVALRQEDLLVPEATIYRFPTDMIRARGARRRMMARRRRSFGIAAVVAASMTLASLPTLG